MNKKELIENFKVFAKQKNIPHDNFIEILEDVFKFMLRKKFNNDKNFNILINLEEGDFEIWKLRTVVDKPKKDLNKNEEISLKEAKAIQEDFEIGEEVAEEVLFEDFGRVNILNGKSILIQKIQDFAHNQVYQHYLILKNTLIKARVSQIFHHEIILLDEMNNPLKLPKSEKIFKDRFKKGETVQAVIKEVVQEKGIQQPTIILSRTSNLFLERLLEKEIPEINDGIINIKKIARIPGEKSKVVVESNDDRIDPVGACIGSKGLRIFNIIQELRKENIDIISYTDNLQLYIERLLKPVKIKSLREEEDKIILHISPEQVSKVFGRNGENLRLTNQILEKEIEIYQD